MPPQFTTTFTDRLATARKVLVVDLGFLGDTVQALPVLADLRSLGPGQLHVVSTPVGSEVLRLTPCVDRIWPLELDRQKRTLRAQRDLIAGLRREAFEVAITFSGNDRNVILTGLCGARWRVAQEQGRRHFWDRWLIDQWVSQRAREQPVFEQRRQVLAALGMPLAAARFALRTAAADAAWAEQTIPKGSLHFSLNSAVPLKEWPVAHYATLTQRLARMFPGVPLAVSVMAKEREQTRLREFLAATPGLPVTVLPAGMRIGQLAAVLQRCRLHFGPDSGVMHLAMALGVPTVSLFREKGNFREWLPALPGHEVLLAPCPCVDHHDAPCAVTGQARCLAAITVDAVTERIAGKLRS